MDRARDCSGQGPHRIGNFHVKHPAARRAWLWRDTGELDAIGTIDTIDWMIAEGPRRRGHASDLQQSHADLLCDPDDTWLPSSEDYEALVAAKDGGWLDRAYAAVLAAVGEAEAQRGEIIPVAIDKLTAAVGQAASIAEITATVIQEYSERWFIVERLRADGSVVQREEAVTLAAAAFHDIEDDSDIEEIFEDTYILEDQVRISPSKHHAWCGIV